MRCKDYNIKFLVLGVNLTTITASVYRVFGIYINDIVHHTISNPPQLAISPIHSSTHPPIHSSSRIRLNPKSSTSFHLFLLLTHTSPRNYQFTVFSLRIFPQPYHPSPPHTSHPAPTFPCTVFTYFPPKTFPTIYSFHIFFVCTQFSVFVDSKAENSALGVDLCIR